MIRNAKPNETKAEYFANVVMGRWVEEQLYAGNRDVTNGFNARREGVLMGLRFAMADPDEPVDPSAPHTPG